MSLDAGLPNRTGGKEKPTEYQPVKAEQQFEADQADDVPLEAQAALVVDEFDQGAGGLADQRELSLHCAAALDQLVLVLQSRIKALELGMVPENIGFFLDLDASDHAVLGQQNVADLPQQLSGLRARPAFALQSYREKNGAVSVADSASNIVVQRLTDLNSALTRGLLPLDLTHHLRDVAWSGTRFAIVGEVRSYGIVAEYKPSILTSP